MGEKDIIKQPKTFTISETEDDDSDHGGDDDEDDDDDCDGDEIIESLSSRRSRFTEVNRN